MEAHDHLNKYGNVKEPYIFKATEDLVRQTQMTQSRKNEKSNPVATFSPWRFIFMSLVAISIFGGAWLLLGGETPASSQTAGNDLVVVAEQASLSNEIAPKDPQVQPAFIPVAVEEPKVKEVAEESVKKEESKEISPAVVSEKLTEKIAEKEDDLKAVDSSSESKQKTNMEDVAIKNAAFHWVVFSAASALEADRKIQEFAKEGVEVLPLSAKAGEGDRIRLIWKKKFDSFESALAEKDKLPAIFGDDAWILKVN